MTVDVYGVRHHGPGSARAVLGALDQQPPDLVLIEGCPELDAIVDLLGEAGMTPPVAGLVYAVDEPRQATFYPLARFSPEWVAARWALARGVPVRFLDLPATHAFPLAAQAASDRPEQAALDEPLDPIGTLAAAAGYDDAERWWEDAVEQRYDSPAERFDAIREAMAAVRSADRRPADDPDVHANARREAWMRKVLRAEMKAAPDSRIAVVCGAWHAPALVPADFPPVARDQLLITKLPRTKVAAAWTPWTAARLSYASGYGAGVGAPCWSQHLFARVSQDDPDPRGLATAWLVRVARTLRDARLDASTASVVEAARLVETLATVRG